MKTSFFCKLLVTMAVLSLDHIAYPLKLSAADEFAVDLSDGEQTDGISSIHSTIS